MKATTARVVLAALLCATACDGGPSRAKPHLPARAVSAKPRAPFVVAIVIDQLAAWVALEKLPTLPRQGGFARLVREGTWVRHLRYPYASTDTAPGHAALHTGKVPAESGVWGNEKTDESGNTSSVLRDPATRMVGPGIPVSEGSSARLLRVPTVADRLRAEHPDALVVSVSLKDRGAILPAGKRPTHVLWYEKSADAFVTSTAFASTYPAWAVPLGSSAALRTLRAAPWNPTDTAWLVQNAPTPDEQLGEGDLDDLNTVFPHTARSAAAFRATPHADEAVARLALAAIDAEYDPARPTLLLLSFSANDIVGHTFGPDSWESWDLVRKLDALLGTLLDKLERKVGPVRVLLSADHGVSSMPEVSAHLRRCTKDASEDPFGRACQSGARIIPDALREELRVAAAKELGAGAWIAGLADPYIFFGADGRALPDGRRKRLADVVSAVMAKHTDTVAAVFDARRLEAECPRILARSRPAPERASAAEDVEALVCRSYPRGTEPAAFAPPGDVYVVPARGCYFDAGVVVGAGASHGTPYLYDRTVPLLVSAKGEIDEGAVVDAPVDFTAYSALEAALLGLAASKSGSARPSPREILASHTAK